MTPAPGPAGRLTLVATPIGNLGDLSPRAVEALAEADVIACEDTRHTRKLLTHAGVPAGRRLLALHEHNEAVASRKVLALLDEGRHVVVVSDAGTPGLSDPGERVVRLAAAAGVTVSTVPGPAAAIAALVVSGLPTGRFCFEGFLPRKGTDRAERLAQLAADQRTTVVYEAPHRVRATVADLIRACGPDRQVALCRELTKRHEEVFRGSLAAAAAHLEASEPRGEFVVVVGPAPAPDTAGDDDIAAALAARLAAGETTKSAVTEVAADLGVPRRRVYQIGIELGRR